MRKYPNAPTYRHRIDKDIVCSLAERLSADLRAEGLTLGVFAFKHGFNSVTLGTYMRGKKPCRSMYEKLCREFGYPPERTPVR